MNVIENRDAKCSRCGAVLAGSALEGLCPRCLMALNLSTEGDMTERSAKGPRPAPPPAEEIAKLFPQLEILECLGRGGMGVVYKARQPLLQRCVALKLLAPEREQDPRFAERFMREAQALARLNHPNIVTVHDFGETNGLYYLLMEYVDGMTLRQLLHGRKLPPEQALAIVPAICAALQFAHEQGIVHRDIKPENVLLDKQGRVKIADFGIAKILGQPAQGAGLTDAKEVVGTAHYMAPEQVESPQTVDHRVDIYSLGVVFYEMLTGELPLGKFAPPSCKAQSDVRLDQVVLRALEKEPARRYQQASQVKSDVETIATHPGSEPAVLAHGEADGPSARASKSGRKRKVVLITSSCVLVLLLLLGAALFIPRPRDIPLFPWTVAFLPGGNTLVSGGGQMPISQLQARGELVFWNTITGKKRVMREELGVRTLACAPNGKFLVLGLANGITRLVDAQSGKTLVSLTPHSALVNAVAASADSQLVASGALDGTVTVWDVPRQHEQTLITPGEQVLGVALAPDHSALVATTRSGKAYLFNLAQGGDPRVLQACPPPARLNANAEAAAFAPDGSSFATVCQRSLRIWDAGSGKLLRDLQGAGSATFLGLAFAPDGQTLATLDSEGGLTLWDPQANEPVTSVKAHNSGAFGVAFSPDSKRVATAGLSDYSVKLWSVPALTPLKNFVRASANSAGFGQSYVKQQLEAVQKGNYWAKYSLWDCYSKGTHGVTKNGAQADKWLREFVNHVSLVRFEPVNGFKPATPMEFLQRIQQYTPVISDRDRLGMGGFFRTTKSDGKLIGSFLSNYPEQLRALLQQNPYLKIVSVEEMTPQGFIEYDQSVQESL